VDSLADLLGESAFISGNLVSFRVALGV
jgi:hypothetical protein